MFSRWALNYRFSKVTQCAGIGHWHAHEGRHTAMAPHLAPRTGRNRLIATLQIGHIPNQLDVLRKGSRPMARTE
jgi:hypothetical protein